MNCERQGRNSRVLPGVTAAAAGLLLAASTATHAGPNDWPYLQQIFVGVHDHATPLTSSGREDGVDISLEAKFRTPPGRFWEAIGSPRPHLGGLKNLGDDTNQVYGGLTYRWWPFERQFLDVSGGAAWHDGELETDDPEKRSLGRRVLFRAALEYGYQVTDEHGVSLAYDHISNGFRSGSNQGLDTLGLRYSYNMLQPGISDGAAIEAQLEGGSTDTTQYREEAAYTPVEDAQPAPAAIQAPPVYLDERVSDTPARQKEPFTIY